VKLIERLDLNPPEYRVKLSDDEIAALGVAMWVFLKHEVKLADDVVITALELAALLRKVRGDRARWSLKMAKKIEQKLKKKPLLTRKK
jgi:hypothetical protein